MSTDPSYPSDQRGRTPEPHPYLHEPLLHISNIPPHVSDGDLAQAFAQCAPFRPNIPRDDGSGMPRSGTIEFRYIEKAERALAILQSRPIPNLHPPVVLTLSPYPSTTPPTPLPPPNASPRLVRHLPSGFTDLELYDLFRPFGALASVRTQRGFGSDSGMVEFWREEDAREAEEAMHCADVCGSNISVQIYNQRKAGGVVSEFSPTAAPFVPAGAIMPYPQSVPPQYSPPRVAPYPPRSPLHFMHGPGQQVQFAPPGSSSHSGLIDPCNLFIKNLDTSIDSNGLFSHFRQFGQIVSARVMRSESGESRGFGFVSFQSPDQATAAMHAMNGVVLGSKQLVVRLHEPKQLRQEKLAARFGHNGHPRSNSGATSPAASEYGESLWPSPNIRAQNLGSPVLGNIDRPDRMRRSSGSYYQAALTGTLNLPMRYEDLAALSPVVRKEVITGELSRRIRAMDIVPAEDLEAIVDSISSLSLAEVVNTIQDGTKLAEQVEHATNALTVSKTSTPNKSPSPPGSQDSRNLDAPNATASAPDHPSTPISMPASLSTPPRTESPSGSVPPPTEKERMSAAIAKLETTQIAELAELLMSLPKRDRAMCLFNMEVLRAKLADAKAVLAADDDDSAGAAVPQTPVTPQAKKVATPLGGTSPKTPDLSSRGPSAAASPAPATPASTTTYTVASLALLPATEVVKLASSSAAGLPVPKADPLVVKATDEFVDSLLDKPIQAQKQALGDKLWRVVKAFGFKGAPKITIALLDQEELRPLAHLMNSYPAILKEKAQLVQTKFNTK